MTQAEQDAAACHAVRALVFLPLAAAALIGGPFIGLISILPAGLYSLAGWGSYLAFWVIMLGATLTVDRLSRTLEAVQRQIMVCQRRAQPAFRDPA